MYTDFGIKGLAVAAVLLAFLVTSFFFFAPLTYGTPGLVHTFSGQDLVRLSNFCSRLAGDEVNRRRIISSWTLHFQSKEIDVRSLSTLSFLCYSQNNFCLSLGLIMRGAMRKF
jgi:dolichyl-phosphate-mannose-protein mannosyltransferase